MSSSSKSNEKKPFLSRKILKIPIWFWILALIIGPFINNDTSVTSIDKPTTTVEVTAVNSYTNSPKPTSTVKPTNTPIVTSVENLTTNEPTVIPISTAIPTDTPIPTNTPTPTEDPTKYVLKRGDKNEDVRQLQKRLIELGYLNDSADGDFGPKTENAVIAYQKAAGLTASGVCDYNTFKSINSQNAPAAPKPTATLKPTNKPSSSGSNKSSGSSGSSGGSYIGNKSSKKFHYSWCSSVGKMKSSNKVSLSSRSDAISKGYEPCKNCNP